MNPDIFGDRKLFRQVALLKEQAAAKLDGQIAALRAREDIDGEELGKQLNKLYEAKFGRQRLKTF